MKAQVNIISFISNQEICPEWDVINNPSDINIDLANQPVFRLSRFMNYEFNIQMNIKSDKGLKFGFCFLEQDGLGGWSKVKESYQVLSTNVNGINTLMYKYKFIINENHPTAVPLTNGNNVIYKYIKFCLSNLNESKPILRTIPVNDLNATISKTNSIFNIKSNKYNNQTDYIYPLYLEALSFSEGTEGIISINKLTGDENNHVILNGVDIYNNVASLELERGMDNNTRKLFHTIKLPNDDITVERVTTDDIYDGELTKLVPANVYNYVVGFDFGAEPTARIIGNGLCLNILSNDVNQYVKISTEMLAYNEVDTHVFVTREMYNKIKDDKYYALLEDYNKLELRVKHLEELLNVLNQ
jgi:hypothetical protein